MSHCQHCGVEVVWAKRPNGKWSRPLEELTFHEDVVNFIEDALVVLNGVVQPARLPRLFIEHDCRRPDSGPGALAWTATRADVRTAPPPSDGPPPSDDVAESRQLQPWEPQIDWLKVICPHCAAREGEPCKLPNGNIAVSTHRDRKVIAHDPTSMDVGPFHRRSQDTPESWQEAVDYARGTEPWRAMRHWLFDNAHLLTDLSTAPVADETASPRS